MDISIGTVRRIQADALEQGGSGIKAPALLPDDDTAALAAALLQIFDADKDGWLNEEEFTMAVEALSIGPSQGVNKTIDPGKLCI